MTTANSCCWLGILFLAACLPTVGADPEFKAGGIALTLPGPANDFVEVGDKLRSTFFELLVPSNNRLVSAYLPAQTLTELNTGKTPNDLWVYGMVEVSKRAEYADCTPQVFEQVLKSFEQSVGTFNVKNVEQELNLRLKSLGAGPFALDHPVMLGGLFQKPNAAAYATLTAIKQDDRSVTMASGAAVLRIKQRLVFAYLYRKFESPDSVIWLRKNIEEWCDTILARNR